MTPAELRILIQEGEGTTLEFKENLSSAFARELVGMANTIGGRILLGVRDDGSVVGVKDSNSLRARIQELHATAIRRCGCWKSRWATCSSSRFAKVRPSPYSAAMGFSGVRGR